MACFEILLDAYLSRPFLCTRLKKKEDETFILSCMNKVRVPAFQIFLVFVIGFALFFGLYGGLPYDFNGDIFWDQEMTSSTSYSHLIQFCLNPTTPAWFFYGRIEELRPFMFILHKFFFENFGTNLVAAHFFIAIAAGFLAVAFFLLSYWITRSKLYSWLIIFLYTSIPTNAPMLAGFLSIEIQFLLSLVTLGAVIVFGILTVARKANAARRLVLVVAWVILTWLAIKWKSSEKILPFVYFAFFVVRFRKIKEYLGNPTLLTLLGLNLLLFILVVPIGSPRVVPKPAMSSQSMLAKKLDSFAKKEREMKGFQLSNFVARTFYLPGQPNPLTHPILRDGPSSFTGDLGILLGWFFWIGLALTPVLMIITRRRNQQGSGGQLHPQLEFRNHMIVLFGIWFSVVVAGFGIGNVLSEVRYLNFALVPAMILLAFLIRLMDDALKGVFALGKVLRVYVLFGFLIAIIQNYAHLAKWVGFFGGIQHALYESEMLIYKDFYGRKPEGWELFQNHTELEKRVILVSWYNLPHDWFEHSIERLKQEKVLFIKTRHRDDERVGRFRNAGYHAERIVTIPFYEAKPLFFRLPEWLIQSGIVGVKDLEIHIYKIT